MFHKIKSTTPDGELVKITFKLYENYRGRDVIFIKKRILTMMIIMIINTHLV